MQRLLGLVQYLSKFLPNLSDMTKPLRDLTQQGTEWCWGDAQRTALSKLKEAVTHTLVLCYYNLSDEVTLQCDASQSGLGAALLQKGEPVPYASRALTPVETRYAQIEKELLAIVFACKRFDTYIYGRDMVTVETDHKPLEAIVRKALNSAPQRLQRICYFGFKDTTLRSDIRKARRCFLLTHSVEHSHLTRACPSLSMSWKEIDHKALLPVSDARWHQIEKASADDPVLQELRSTIQRGWPVNRAETPQCLPITRSLLKPHFDMETDARALVGQKQRQQ